MSAERYRVLAGDALDILKTMESATVDALVTDPPSGTGFLGNEWDKDKGGRDEWIEWLRRIGAELVRVMKPGAYGLAWALPRTAHWTGMALELAGFEVRDQITHIFGTGFPKSLRIDAAIDKMRGDSIEHVREYLRVARDRLGLTNRQVDDAFGFNGMACHWITHPTQPSLPTPDQWEKLKKVLDLDASMDAEFQRLAARKGTFGEAWEARPVTGEVKEWAPGVAYQLTSRDGLKREKAVRQESAAWEGWGTGLRPAHEVWLLVRAPLAEPTTTRQILRTGTGALNLLGAQQGREGHAPNLLFSHAPACDMGSCAPGCPVFELGRERAHFFPVFRYEPKPTRAEKEEGLDELEARTLHRVNPGGLENDPRWAPVTVKNHHPTVKPLELMRWLARLVTPPEGLVMDPFTGSGTTGAAALEEGFRFIGTEKDPEFARIAEARLREAALDVDERARRRIIRANIHGQGLLPLGGPGEGEGSNHG